jgi:phosphoenolpyruvate-protein kinase (PTS system EI component)
LEILEETGRSPETRALDSDELNIMLALQRARASEVSAEHPGHQRATKRIAQAKQQNALTESYRRIDVAAALEMLH